MSLFSLYVARCFNFKMKHKHIKPKNLPLVLLILDGWGVSDVEKGNAIALADTPNYDSLCSKYPYTTLSASGTSVGLIENQIGNSEAGHMNIGAGRVVQQDIARVHEAIGNGSFFNNPAFEYAYQHTDHRNSDVHLMGIITGEHSGHSHPRHIHALIEFFRLRNARNIYLHLFTDGRDAPPRDGLVMVQRLRYHLQENEKIATISGRLYLDRKKDWPMTEKIYDALTIDRTLSFSDPEAYIQESYQKGITDEFIQPACLTDDSGEPVGRIRDGDAVVFFNLRSDRARQLTKPFVQKNFESKNAGAFKRKKILQDIAFVTMTDFGPDLGDTLTAFPSPDIKDTLPVMLHGLRQLYIAETEKYAHITYFFNGGYSLPIAGEERRHVKTPTFKDYSLKPQMAAYELTDEICKSLDTDEYDFIGANFANADMVGHTGNLGAAILACETIDKCIGKIYDCINRLKGTLIITGDHGNAESIIGSDDNINTSHDANPVPFVVISDNSGVKNLKLSEGGKLADIAPTILDLLGIPKSEAMTGNSLIKRP